MTSSASWLNQPQSAPSDSRDLQYAVGLTVLFLSVAGFAASHHEMWRDELQAWLIARDAGSIVDVFERLKYEGHPALWYVCLYALAKLTWSPVIMQVFHVMVAGATVFLFVWQAPFTRLQKALYPFGYFALFEYAVLSRNYAPGILLITVACVLFPRRFTAFVWIGAVLALAAQTSVHALIIVIALAVGLAGEYILRRQAILADPSVSERRIMAGFGLMLVGIVAFAVMVGAWARALDLVGHRPTSPTQVTQINGPDPAPLIEPSGAPPDEPASNQAAPWAGGGRWSRLERATTAVTRSFLPVPNLAIWFWNHNVLEGRPLFKRVELGVSCFIIAWCFLVLTRSPMALITYVTGLAGLLSLFAFVYFGYLRHQGFVFVLFVTAVWISRYSYDARSPGWVARAVERSQSLGVTLILAIHLFGGTIAVWMDHRYEFSQGKRTAEFIRDRGLDGAPIVGHPEYAMGSIAGYLRDSRFYFPQTDRIGSFLVTERPRRRVSERQIVESAAALSAQKGEDVLIALTRHLPSDVLREHTIDELASFTPATVDDEVFVLYRLRR